MTQAPYSSAAPRKQIPFRNFSTVFAAFVSILSSGAALAQDLPTPAVIVGTTIGGVGFVEIANGVNGINSNIGRWDTPYPFPETGESAPGLEPEGKSILNVDIDVNDGGIISFSYRIRTYDAGKYNWLDIYIESPTGLVRLVDHLGKPGSDYGVFWQSPLRPITYDLKAWRNQRIRVVFSTTQDGHGDQSVSDILGLSIRFCHAAPLNPLTDAEALLFEAGNGNIADTERLDPILRDRMLSLQAKIQKLGGSFEITSAFRPPAYQEHLREVHEKWSILKDNRDLDCTDVKNEIKKEFIKHGLLLTQRPAGPNSKHCRGLAFDARFSVPPPHNIDDIANEAQLHRPFKVKDPVHFQMK